MNSQKFYEIIIPLRNKCVAPNIRTSSELHKDLIVPEDDYIIIPKKEYTKLLSVQHRLGRLEQYLFGGTPKFPSEMEEYYDILEPIMEKILKENSNE